MKTRSKSRPFQGRDLRKEDFECCARLTQPANAPCPSLLSLPRHSATQFEDTEALTSKWRMRKHETNFFSWQRSRLK